jgi:hypothetical protein
LHARPPDRRETIFVVTIKPVEGGSFMRKLFLTGVLVLAFAGGIFAGVSTNKAEAGSCFNMCNCNGQGLKCYVTPFGLACKPDPNWNCPQGANC